MRRDSVGDYIRALKREGYPLVLVENTVRPGKNAILLIMFGVALGVSFPARGTYILSGCIA